MTTVSAVCCLSLSIQNLDTLEMLMRNLYVKTTGAFQCDSYYMFVLQAHIYDTQNKKEAGPLLTILHLTTWQKSWDCPV